MDKINTLDLKTFAEKSMTEVFDTMLSMEVALFDPACKIELDATRIVGSVSFAGAVMGCVSIQLLQDFARFITASMLGMEPEEIESDEEVNDVIGELSNMVGGGLKSRLCDAGLACALSIPSITTGSDFCIKSKGWVRNERFGFRHQQHVVVVEIFIKSVN
jgi:chemotaxis protein CheX